MIKSGVVPQQGEDVDENEAESREGDGVRRHGEREAFDGDISVEWLEDVFGE